MWGGPTEVFGFGLDGEVTSGSHDLDGRKGSENDGSGSRCILRHLSLSDVSPHLGQASTDL